MLKKAGILVAVAAAGVLAVAPLAFAGEPTTHTQTTKNSPSCTFANGSDARTSTQTASGVAASLLGLVGTGTNAAAPVTTQGNAPVLSCNNVSDVLDQDSNNTTKTIDNSKDIDKSTSIGDLGLGGIIPVLP